MGIIENAEKLAEFYHRDQTRKNGDPYFNHVKGVADIIRKLFDNTNQTMNSEILIAVAYLHDLLEDTSVTPQQIENETNKTCLEYVQKLTNDKRIIKEIGKREYIANKFVTLEPDVLLVKLADRLYNICDLKKIESDNRFDEFRNKYRDDTGYALDKCLIRTDLESVHLQLILEIEKNLW